MPGRREQEGFDSPPYRACLWVLHLFFGSPCSSNGKPDSTERRNIMEPGGVGGPMLSVWGFRIGTRGSGFRVSR